MPDRLSPLDASFLFMEEPTTAMHVGGVMTFDPPAGSHFDIDGLIALIGSRLAEVPRYRQKIREVPGRLGLPVWVDDPDFDLTYHVRRSALPKPGTDAQLRELVGRLQSRQLDRTRPLWELYLVEGLEDGRVAVVSKIHHAMVDGLAAVDIGALLLDATPEPRKPVPDEWQAVREPSDASLVATAVTDVLRRPRSALDAARLAAGDVRSAAVAALTTAGAILATARSAARGAPRSPLNAEIGQQRRYGMVATRLDDYKRIRKAYDATVNDVVLATVTGALRAWLATRGEPITASSTVRAMVPVSVRNPSDTGGNQVSAIFVDLPVGEADPVERLTQISKAMVAHKQSGQSVGATALIGLVGFAPPTIHGLAARLASAQTSRVFNVVVTNVPGPQFPLYALGAQAQDMYPVVPLAKGQAVSIGLTSYNGGVYYGLNADRDAMPDVDVLAECIGDSLAELLDTVR